jgi:hypothetical protein
MYAIFLLILILLLGLNVVTAMKNGYLNSLVPTVVTVPATKTESFLNPQQADADYRLLTDMLPSSDPKSVIVTTNNSETCRLLDDSVSLQDASDYSQRTNNYKRDYPDSCSSPWHELTLNFYQTTSLKPIQATSTKC